MKTLAAILIFFPSIAWADCTNVGAVLMNCDGERGYRLGNQTYVYAPGGGLEPYTPPSANSPSFSPQTPIGPADTPPW
jgi:hypothetical protein